MYVPCAYYHKIKINLSKKSHSILVQSVCSVVTEDNVEYSFSDAKHWPLACLPKSVLPAIDTPLRRGLSLCFYGSDSDLAHSCHQGLCSARQTVPSRAVTSSASMLLPSPAFDHFLHTSWNRLTEETAHFQRGEEVVRVSECLLSDRPPCHSGP